jgi:hypothetical protein
MLDHGGQKMGIPGTFLLPPFFDNFFIHGVKYLRMEVDVKPF